MQRMEVDGWRVVSRQKVDELRHPIPMTLCYGNPTRHESRE